MNLYVASHFIGQETRQATARTLCAVLRYVGFRVEGSEIEEVDLTPVLLSVFALTNMVAGRVVLKMPGTCILYYIILCCVVLRCIILQYMVLCYVLYHILS